MVRNTLMKQPIRGVAELGGHQDSAGKWIRKTGAHDFQASTQIDFVYAGGRGGLYIAGS